MDPKGFHLIACKWGGWIIKRHDDAAEELCNWMKAAGMNATTHLKNCCNGLPRWRDKPKICDIIAKDQRGATTIFDVMVTRVDQQAHRNLSAASAGEKTKYYLYNKHNNNCRADGCKDSRLNIQMIPIVFESPSGAAGKAMKKLIASVLNHHRTFILPFDDKEESTIFQRTWMHRISTCLQIGTANMIYNIPSGRSTASRISKDSYSQQIWKNIQIETETGENQNEHRENQEIAEEVENPKPKNNQKSRKK